MIVRLNNVWDMHTTVPILSTTKTTKLLRMNRKCLGDRQEPFWILGGYYLTGRAGVDETR